MKLLSASALLSCARMISANYVMDVYDNAGCTNINDAQPTVTFIPEGGDNSGCFSLGEAHVKMGCRESGNVDVKLVNACSDDMSAGTALVSDRLWSEAAEFLKGQKCVKMDGESYLFGKLKTSVDSKYLPLCDGSFGAKTASWVMTEYMDDQCSVKKPAGTNQYTFKMQSDKASDHCWAYGTGSFKAVCSGDQVRVEQYSDTACFGTPQGDVIIVSWEDAKGFFAAGKCVRFNENGGTYGKLDGCVPAGRFPKCGSMDDVPECDVQMNWVNSASQFGTSVASLALALFVFLL